jgi:hypothetical protein
MLPLPRPSVPPSLPAPVPGTGLAAPFSIRNTQVFWWETVIFIVTGSDGRRCLN